MIIALGHWGYHRVLCWFVLKLKLPVGSIRKWPRRIPGAGGIIGRFCSFFGILPEKGILLRHDKLTGAGSTGISVGGFLFTAKQKIWIYNIDPGQSAKFKVGYECSLTPTDKF